MKNYLLIVALLLAGVSGYPQIIVNKGIYKASFSNTLHEPRYVSYMLYKGGGDCSRDGYSFKCDVELVECATDMEYAGSGYDKGHLANAEDFAKDCDKDELTFRYYNCLPQTPNLNRGKWKTNETKIREWSQTQKLFIICGGFFGSKRIGTAAVPNACWKVVQSAATKQVLFCGWFTNTSHATMEEITVAELESRLDSHINLLH